MRPYQLLKPAIQRSSRRMATASSEGGAYMNNPYMWATLGILGVGGYFLYSMRSDRLNRAKEEGLAKKAHLEMEKNKSIAKDKNAPLYLIHHSLLTLSTERASAAYEAGKDKGSELEHSIKKHLS